MLPLMIDRMLQGRQNETALYPFFFPVIFAVAVIDMRFVILACHKQHMKQFVSRL
jgi:hypothetical protein